MKLETQPGTSWLEKPLLKSSPNINVEKIIIVLIILLAFLSRLYNVGARVMAHDEVNHVVPSYDLSIGKGYIQDPVTHGPLQFHLIALTYFIFGDSDFTSRVPAALFSVAAVVVVLLCFRRYLGKWGHLIGGLLFLISPYLLFYGRYTRNEGLIELIAVLMIYATLRYLDKGDKFSLFLLVISQALNFTAKETAYIYMAQILLFLAIQFIFEITKEKWPTAKAKQLFTGTISFAIAFLIIGIGLAYAHIKENPMSETGEALATANPSTLISSLSNLAVILALLAGAGAIYVLLKELGLKRIKHLRTFDLLIVNGTIILPLLAAFPIKIIGSIFNQSWKATDYSSMRMLRIGISLLILSIIAVAIGLWWDKKKWIPTAIVFWSIFVIFYTTFFTNGQGFFTGIVGSLGYWLEQQAVNRGQQPIYYYLLLQIPFYEYLPALGFFVAAFFGSKYYEEASLPALIPTGIDGVEDVSAAETDPADTGGHSAGDNKETVTYRVPVLFMFTFYSLTGLVAYSMAGEKMPWLTVHIAIPLILTAAWGFNQLITRIPWHKLRENKQWVAILLLPLVTAGFFGILSSLGKSPAPFQGKSLDELRSTSTFLFSAIGFGAALYGILYFLKDWKFSDVLKLISVMIFGFLALLTLRTAYIANYINYDTGKEFLVYAHADRGPKDILEQVEEISERTVGGKDIVVAYDNDGLYPYWWYFRDYPNKMWYTDQPTRDLLNATVILSSSKNLSKIEALTKSDYTQFKYTRLVWPMQDYYFLTWERVKYALTNTDMRAALFDIWLNKDYTSYAEIKGRTDLTVASWQPSELIYMFVRNDVVSQIWNYGSVTTTVVEPEVDPYEGLISLSNPDKFFGEAGDQPGQLNMPRGVAVAADGSLYVADTLNYRIQHFSAAGEFINSWGSFADISVGDAPGGTFNEPWGIAIGPDGSIYVTDTWNHRVQKFDSNGTFLTEWGYFGTAETPDGFWGPRGIAVNQDGRVFVTDTGNKRIVVFDENGEFITQFGEAGFDFGQLDEPVGISLGLNGEVYVADTWNQRIQVFIPNADNSAYFYSSSWDISGWNGQSLENKPFLATDLYGNIYATDPEGYRVLAFQPDGTFLKGWGDYSPNSDGFGLPAAIAVDPNDNGIWVSDAGNNRILHFPFD
jgi:predicted membrane-bound mannosyltransferase/DNA-binding beta-propeller fold protein YncE